MRASVPDHECFVVGITPYVASRSPSLWVPNPVCFIAGEIHRHPYIWDKLTRGLPNRDEIIGSIHEEASVFDFFPTVQGTVWWLHLRFRLPCAKIVS